MSKKAENSINAVKSRLEKFKKTKDEIEAITQDFAQNELLASLDTATLTIAFLVYDSLRAATNLNTRREKIVEKKINRFLEEYWKDWKKLEPAKKTSLKLHVFTCMLTMESILSRNSRIFYDFDPEESEEASGEGDSSVRSDSE